ncbi:MAG: sensor histidine kinase [Steroidobacteraceae bacterium]
MDQSEASHRRARNRAIARAKQEWECIADALPELLCLLNCRGEILRTNRVVERWSIGKVQDVLGLDLHSALHGDCDDARCPLLHSLQAAWIPLSNDGHGEFELADPGLDKTLKFEMRRLPDAVDGPAGSSSNYAVCIVSDITQLRASEREQQVMQEELERRVLNRTAELTTAVDRLEAEVARRELAEGSLRTSRNELSRLSEQLMRAQEIERKRIAQDLHDAVGQSLSAIKYSLERAIQMHAAPQLGDPMKVLCKAVEHVQNTIEEVRTISENLRPALLDALGAVSAIRWLCREWSEVFTEVEVDIQLHLTDADVDEPLGTTLFRTVQESLNNVARHSKASRVTISAAREPSYLRLHITDNGVGFEPDSRAMRRGHGLAGIRERATNTGGMFSLISFPGGGTQLTLHWPPNSVEGSGVVKLCASR